MRQTLIRLAIVLIALSVACPSHAIRKKKGKKSDTEIVAMPEPDPLPNSSKSMPDARPRRIRQPIISAFTVTAGRHLKGIDVSHYQGRIDWRTVSQHRDVGYVYLKATEGNTLIDDTYEYNLKEAQRHGLKVGSYHFFRPAVSAISQFANFKKVVDKRKQDLLPLIDVEVTGGVPIATLHTRLQEFLRLVTEEYGRRPVIYTGRNFYNRYFAEYNYFKAYQFMIAQYTPEEPYLTNGDDYIIWQYTSKGRIPGIRGDVDQSRFVGHHSLTEILYK